jgi:hypothetical protein
LLHVGWLVRRLHLLGRSTVVLTLSPCSAQELACADSATAQTHCAYVLPVSWHKSGWSRSRCALSTWCCGKPDALTFPCTHSAVCCCALQAQRDLLALLSADNQDVDLKRMGVLTGLAVGLHNLVSGWAGLRLPYVTHQAFV